MNSTTFNGKKILDGASQRPRSGWRDGGGNDPIAESFTSNGGRPAAILTTHSLILDGDGFSGTNYAHGLHVPNQGAAASGASATVTRLHGTPPRR